MVRDALVVGRDDDSPLGRFDGPGFWVARSLVPQAALAEIRGDLVQLGRELDPAWRGDDVHELWRHLKHTDRAKGGALYNGFKYLPSVLRLAASKEVLDDLHRSGFSRPAIVDINCRIDSKGEEKFLFGWHQDYWFSVTSPSSLVAWISLVPLVPEMGGLSVIGNDVTGGRVFRTRQGDKYDSYADAVVLDEDIPTEHAQVVDRLNPGDVLFFRFDVLHMSRPVLTDELSRFTVQVRYADFGDESYKANRYRPGVVTSSRVDYLSEKAK